MLRQIASENLCEYVRYSIQEPQTRAARAQVINFSFLNQTTKVPLPKTDMNR